MPGDIHVRTTQLTKAYGEGRAPVIADVNTEITRGEFVVLVGRSGSGKSTLLNLLGGLDRPTGGDVVIDGRSLASLDEDALARLRREHMGFVFQFFNLVPTLTALENVMLPLELAGKQAGESVPKAEGWLDRVGLRDRGGAFPDELSGGEQQRVALARALVHAPGLVIADEPTGNLDLETARQVLALLDELCRQQGTTLIMATHSEEVIGIADRVVHLHAGHLAPADAA